MTLFKRISASSITLGLSFALRFLLTFLFARFLTPDQLGIYSWSVTAFGIASIVTNFGVDLFLMRKIPEYRNASTMMVGRVIAFCKKQVKVNSILIISIILPISYFSIEVFESAAQYNLQLIVINFA